MAEKKDEEEGAKKEGEGEHAAPKKKSKLLLIIIVAVVVLGGGAGAFLALSGGSEEVAEGEEEEEAPRHLATTKLEPFVVNLSDQTSYIKATVVLEFDADLVAAASEGAEGGGGGHGGGGAGGEAAPAGPPAIFVSREPMLRDSIIQVLASKRKEDVLSQAGKEQLKEEILDAANEALGTDEPVITNVYFLEFIIQ